MLSRRFEQALVYAAKLHAKQLRKGTPVPYVAHLLAVAGLVLEHGATEDETIAALLHDAVEDQGGLRTLAAIRRRFGPAVADIVLACSDTASDPKPPWRERKEAYLSHLQGASRSVLLVSAADKLHNARSTVADLRVRGAAVWERFRAGPAEQLWYYDALATFADKTMEGHALARELRDAVTALAAATRT